MQYDDDDHNPALLPLPLFAERHLQHTLSHPPDSVLFPFLHGLEGANAAQNTFFGGRARAPPRFRGLVWVVAEEDLAECPRELAVLRRKRDGGFGEGVADEVEFDDDEDEDDDDEEDEFEIDDEPGDVRVATAMDVEDGIQVVPEKVKEHMHPVVRIQTSR